MKKSSFISLVLGTVSGMMFALGMCMVLLPEWNAFRPGVIFAGLGIIMALVTVLVWRKMTGKEPVHITGKMVTIVAMTIVGTLLLGVGMCCCMVWDKLVPGIIIGMGGIVVLLCLIPVIKGIEEG